MNNEEKATYREQKTNKPRLILWIIGTVVAIAGAYNSHFGNLFHLKSALLTWFSAWFIAFGWMIQTWYYSCDDEEKIDRTSGIMTLSSNPLLLSDYMIVSSLIAMAIHPILLISWIILIKIIINYLLTDQLNVNIFKLENFSFKLGYYKESNRTLNLRKGLNKSSGTAIITLVVLMAVLILRNRAINRALPIEIETSGLVLLLVFISLKIYLTINRQTNTNINSQQNNHE